MAPRMAPKASIDYRSAEGSVDGTMGGAMYQEELDRKHETALIHKAYKQRLKETRDTMPNLMPRETLAERRARIELLFK